MKRIILLIFLIAVSTQFIEAAPSSKNFFIVIAKNGEIVARSKKLPQWKVIARGDSLTAADELKLSQGCYLNLMHSSGKNLELRNPGIIFVSNLFLKMPSKQSALYLRFFSYVTQELTKTTNIKSSYSPGSVERGLSADCFTQPKHSRMSNVTSGGDEDRNTVPVVFPKHICLINPVVSFSWIKVLNLNNFEFRIINSTDSMVFAKRVFDSTVTLDLKSMNLMKSTCYYWFVEAGIYKSEPYCIYLFSDEEIKAVKDTVAMIENEFKNDKGPMPKLVLASFYARNYLVKEALFYFRQAADLAPGIKDYQDYYNAYLNECGLADNRYLMK